MKKIIIGCDSAGKDLMTAFCEYMDKEKIPYEKIPNPDRDYPLIAFEVAEKVTKGDCFGVLICGTGIGMSIAANKVPGIRAALCSDTFSAEMTRRHNDANVLCIGARVMGQYLALKILEEFLANEFDDNNDPQGRHLRRISLIGQREMR